MIKASVIFFNGSRGQVNVEGSRRPTWIRMEDEKEVGCGAEVPAFKETAPLESRFPRRKEQVMCEVEKIPGKLFMSLPVYRVVCWAFLSAWRKAEKEIAGRPVYTVWQQVFVNGHRAPNDTDREVFAGTLPQFHAAFPKGLPVAMKPMEYVYMWVQDNGAWKPCADPTAPVQIVVTEEKPVVTAFTVEVKPVNVLTQTPIQKQAMVVKATPTAKPVAMPKRQPKALTHVVASFDDLKAVFDPVSTFVEDNSVRVDELVPA